MMILAIDPGPRESAYVFWNGNRLGPHLVPLAAFGNVRNEHLASYLSDLYGEYKCLIAALVIEEVCSYGMPVGREVFDTVWWSGRFAEAFNAGRAVRLPRLTVKMHLCRDSRAKDSHIRQALLDRFGGKAAAVGTKKQPGPLYGVHGDCWQALALAVTWWDLHKTEGQP